MLKDFSTYSWGCLLSLWISIGVCLGMLPCERGVLALIEEPIGSPTWSPLLPINSYLFVVSHCVDLRMHGGLEGGPPPRGTSRNVSNKENLFPLGVSLIVMEATVLCCCVLPYL